MRNAFFGLGLQYDNGDGPTIAINRSGRVLDVHKNEAGFTLYYRAGQTNQMTVDWGESKSYTTGVEPSVALNNNNRVVEVHKNEAGVTLYSSIGTLSGNSISWNSSPKDYTTGVHPSVALNDAGDVVEVHRSEKTTRLYYRFGKLGATNVDWKWDDNYDTGANPKVAINNSDWVVEVHESEGFSTVWYHVGRIDEANKKITFGDSHKFGDGTRPTVALTDSGDVIVSYQSGVSLMQRFGKVNTSSKTIDWTGDAKNYDDGVKPSVAAVDGMAVEAHEGELAKTLWFSTSMITDRAIWMTERRAQLGPLKIPQIVFPSSHDSAMYTYGLSALGKTQYLSVFDQLEYGIRYFDLRPKKSGDKIIIHHGPIAGPDLSTILAEIQRYCNFGHRELIIIDWSHFDNWDATVYQQFVTQVNNAIGRWLWKTPLQPGQRLADIPLSTFTANGPCIISAVAEQWAVNNPQAGFWIFRDWDASDSNVGNLVVFDKYSDTTNYEQMKNDQLLKFATFTGKQEKFPTLPVDMFLLSWTLTPVTGVWFASKDANRNLGNVLPTVQNPNGYGRIMNCLYVDYVEYARVTDCGIKQNDYLAARVAASSKLSISKEGEPSVESAAVDVPAPDAPPKQPNA